MPTFFVDRNLGKTFPKILSENNIDVITHDDIFEQSTPDEEWLEAAGKNGWYVITLDKRIRYVPVEKEAVKEFNIGFFVLSMKNMSMEERAYIFIKNYRRICRFINRTPLPFVATISRTGEINKKDLG